MVRRSISWFWIVRVCGRPRPGRHACATRPGACSSPADDSLAADLIGGSGWTRWTAIRLPRGACPLLDNYKNGLQEAGFGELTVVDITRMAWWRFYRHSREYFAAKLLGQQIDQDQYNRILTALPGGGRAVVAYLLVSATKK